MQKRVLFFQTIQDYVKTIYANKILMWQSNYQYVYNYTDHLGNIHLSYAWDEAHHRLKVLQENNYYPFGLKHGKYNAAKQTPKLSATNEKEIKQMQPAEEKYKYEYNGKELQEEFGLNCYDYGARNYDVAIGRWMSVDSLAEKTMTLYQYVNNNPVNVIDPTGMEGEDWVERKDGSIYWDNNATSQATTQAGEIYRGKEYRRFENIGSSTYNDVNYNSDKTITSTQRARPDADRIVTQPESIDWYHFGGGAPLTVDISKFNFTSSKLSIEDFKTNSQSVDFFNGWSNHPFSSNIIWRPARDETLSDVYGTIRLAIVNRSLGQVRVVTDDTTGFFDVFDYSALGAVVGDRLRSNGNPTPFGFYGTGTGTIKLTTPKPIQPKFPTGPKW